MKNSRIDLRYYFITDDRGLGPAPLQQAEIALEAGATVIQYRNKRFCPADLEEAGAIADLCALHQVPFIVNDDMVLARAVGASGVHLGQTDADPGLARQILGPEAIIGISVSTPGELARTDTAPCDYLGTGPVFGTDTKADASPVIGVNGLAAVSALSPLPVVAIGGITPDLVSACLAHGASGTAIISAITRAADPPAAARRFARACGVCPRPMQSPWQDEFLLIRKFLELSAPAHGRPPQLRVGAGDDAALMETIFRPVISTDTQHENVHFRRDWQSFSEIGYKAVETAFSDLAASYASPLALFVNLSLPKTVSEQNVLELYEGMGVSLARRGAALGGGNVSFAPNLALDLFVVGRGHGDLFPVRSAAMAGNGLYVTGTLGRARAGLDCLMRGDPDFPGLINAFKRPWARFDAASILAAHEVTCVMDLSDGLAGDVRHMAEASGVTAALDLSQAPVDPQLAAYCEKYQVSPADIMAAGGEDYELLFACPPGVFAALQPRLPGAFCVGTCLSYTGEPVQGLARGIRSFGHTADKAERR